MRKEIIFGIILILIGLFIEFGRDFIATFVLYNGIRDSVFIYAEFIPEDVNLNLETPAICNSKCCAIKKVCDSMLETWCNKCEIILDTFYGFPLHKFEYIDKKQKIIYDNKLEWYIDGNLIQNPVIFKSGDKYIVKDGNNYYLIENYILKYKVIVTDTAKGKCQDGYVLWIKYGIGEGKLYIPELNKYVDSNWEEVHIDANCDFHIICDENICKYVEWT